MPVLCNYPGWVSDMLDEWQAGVSVPPNDPKAFAAALVDLSERRNNLEQMSRQARALAESKFDRKELARQFIDVLEHVAADEKSI